MIQRNNINRSQALSWAFFALSQHTDVKNHLFEEIDDIMKENLVPTYDQVKEMKYAKAVFNETVRLYPTAPNFVRTAIQDDILPDGTVVKKGWGVAYNHAVLSRLTKLWGPDASEFKPERFLDKKYSPFKFTSFLQGPRACLGRTLAELQGVFTMVSILKQFDFEVVDPASVKIKQSTTLPMKNGLVCSFKLRSRNQ